MVAAERQSLDVPLQSERMNASQAPSLSSTATTKMSAADAKVLSVSPLVCLCKAHATQSRAMFSCLIR